MTSIRLSPLGMRVCALAAGAALLAGCSGKSAPPQMPPAAVGVMVVAPQKVPLVRDATGRLSAFRSADVRARVSGVLLKRTYDEGTHVDKGQVLFEIDPAPLKAALSAAQASLAQAQASYANAHVNADRARQLAPKGYISRADLDKLEATERTSRAAVQAARAQVQTARINLGYATVRAPIAGRAGKQQVTEGALVGQGSATLLTTVRQIDPIYVNFDLPVGELQQLRADQARGSATLSGTRDATVQLKLPDGSTYPQPGALDFAGAAVDPSTGAVTLRALVPNPEHVLLPGMYATLEVHLGTLNHAYLIPQAAVLRDATSAYVFTVGTDNKVARKNITTDGQRGSDWIVTQGLAVGDRVIVSGVIKARVGAEVKPTVEPGHAPARATSAAAPASTPPATGKPAAPSSPRAPGKPAHKA